MSKEQFIQKNGSVVAGHGTSQSETEFVFSERKGEVVIVFCYDHDDGVKLKMNHEIMDDCADALLDLLQRAKDKRS